jgi:hypothetical protein
MEESQRAYRWSALLLISAWLPGGWAWGIAVVPPPDLIPLYLQWPVPYNPSIYQYVANKQAAIELGKAIFWDMQAGSDGIQACAS